MKSLLLSTLVGSYIISISVFAAGQPRPPQPPLEAFQACENKQVNDAVTIVTPYGDEIAATCKTVKHPDEGKLVAVPNNKPQQPPQENGDNNHGE